MNCRWIIASLIIVCLAQTSPTRAWIPEPPPEVIFVHVAPDGDDKNDGDLKPVRTLTRAQELVRQHQKRPPRAAGQSTIHVAIRPGFYALDKPLVFTDEDLPRHREVLWHRNSGEGIPPVISGGRKLGPWRVAGDVWQVDVPQQDGKPWNFRDLYINGQRRPRARTPNVDYFRVAKSGPDRRTSFAFKAGDIKSIVRPAEAEIVFLHDWSISRIGIKSIDEAAATIAFTHPIGNAAPHYAIDHFEPHPRYYLEGAREYLDAPGEWYLDVDAGVLSYRPLAGEKPDQTEAIAPALETLLEFRFTAQQKMPRPLNFHGLTFAYTNWPLPAQGYAGSQSAFYENRGGDLKQRGSVTPAVIVDGASDCSFQSCTFTHLGGSGLHFRQECRGCSVSRSEFIDIGANGAMIGETNTREGKVSTANTVSLCRIERCGQTDFGAVGVWVGIAAETNVINNEISQLPYTGISVGWKWDPTPTGCRANEITQNHIHRVLQKLSDGGGIYTLGRQPDTVLRANHIHDIPVNLGRAESNGVFLDEGSSEIRLLDNLIYNIDRSPIRFHKAKNVTIENNGLVNRPGVPTFRYNNADEKSMTIRGNSLSETQDFKPPAESPALKAGIQNWAIGSRQ